MWEAWVPRKRFAGTDLVAGPGEVVDGDGGLGAALEGLGQGGVGGPAVGELGGAALGRDVLAGLDVEVGLAGEGRAGGGVHAAGDLEPAKAPAEGDLGGVAEGPGDVGAVDAGGEAWGEKVQRYLRSPRASSRTVQRRRPVIRRKCRRFPVTSSRS